MMRRSLLLVFALLGNKTGTCYGFYSPSRMPASNSFPPTRIRQHHQHLIRMVANQPRKPRLPQRTPLGSWMCDYDIEGNEGRHFVALYDDCSVVLARDGSDDAEVKGRWKASGQGEFQFTLGLTDSLRYVGHIRKFSTLINGCIIEGEMDPVTVGKFRLTPIQEEMSNALKRAVEAKEEEQDMTPIYGKEKFLGKWMLIHSNDSVVFQLRLDADGSFSSFHEASELGRLSGRWKLWGRDKILLTLVKLKSRVNLPVDYNYWGLKIDGDGLDPQQINGLIMYGHFEPTSIGEFKMAKLSDD